jgi:FkbM family methyltransferase
MIDTVRKLCGYKFPRLGKFVNNCFFIFCPKHVQCELFPDIHVKLNLKDLTQQATFWQGKRFEFPTIRVLDSWDGSIFFDIGANYGFYSLYFLHSFPESTVYAFEPNPETYLMLSKIKQENKLQRLQIFQQGLGAQSGEYYLHLDDKDSGYSTFLNNPDFVDHSISKVKIETFEQWIVDHKFTLPNTPEWVAKIDVEGMELDVLIGMGKALQARVFKGIVIEVSEHTLALAGNKPEDIFDFMKSMGYKPIATSELLQKYKRIKTANIFFEPV